MAFKSVLKPENSIIAGLATVALVGAVYQLDVGPVSMIHLTDPGSTEAGAGSASIRKAGYTSLVMVAGISLLARDPNIAILGGASIIAFQAHYRHASLVHPGTGQIMPPGPSSYQPAQAIVPGQLQAVPG